MDKNIETTQTATIKRSKKEISQSVYEKLAVSLAEFNLEGKKYDNKLKKVSKLFAGDIAKANRKKEKAKAKEATKK